MPRINRKGKKNGSRSKTAPGYTYRVYCGECTVQARPTESAHRTISYTNPPTVIVCKEGHVTKVRK